MAPIFIIFLSILTAFLLLTVAAVVRSALHFFRPPSSANSQVAESGNLSTISDGLLLAGVATSWYAVAMGWSGQFTGYPIYPDMAKVGTEAFNTFGHSYLSHLPVSLIPIGSMCLIWVLLLWFPSQYVPRRTVWVIVSLCVGFVIVTPFSAFAQDRMLEEGFSESVYGQLMWSNGARSVIFTAIGLLSLAAVRSRWTTPSNHEPGA